MRSELYRVLRRELKEAGLDTAYLAQLMGRSPSYINQRFRAVYPWDQDDIYRIMDLLHLDYEQIPVVFPLKGMYAGDLSGKEPTTEDRLCAAIKDYIKEVIA